MAGPATRTRRQAVGAGAESGERTGVRLGTAADDDELARRTIVDLAARREETDGLDRSTPAAEAGASVNEIHLVGRLGATSQERTLPSGDTVLTFHVVVDRASTGSSSGRPRPGKAGGAGSDGVDTLACAAWSARSRRTVRTLEPGTWVEVHGALRRRFRRGAVPPVSFYEVEVLKVRRVR